MFKKGKGWRQETFFLKVSSNLLKNSRFGFVVSAKVSKKAVIRNKIKRRLREIVDGQIKQRNLKAGFDVVINALPGSEQKEFGQLKIDLLEIFKKARITNH